MGSELGAARPGAARVVGLGLCVIDHLYQVEALASGAPRLRFTERLVSGGGMVGTALVQVARLGVDAHALSLVGDDADGRLVRRGLRSEGITTQRLLTCAERPTTVAVVLVDRRTGERRFVVPDRRRLERGVPDFDLVPIRSGAVLLIDGHFPAQARRALARARRLGVPVVGDFSDPRPEFMRLLPWVDHPIVAQEFVDAFTGGNARETLTRLRDEFGGSPIVTLGARGGIYLEGARVRRFASPRVRVRDTTGAGDAFHGAFAAGLARGLPLPAILALAARAGAVCCTALGGRTRLLSAAEAGYSDASR